MHKDYHVVVDNIIKNKYTKLSTKSDLIKTLILNGAWGKARGK